MSEMSCRRTMYRVRSKVSFPRWTACCFGCEWAVLEERSSARTWTEEESHSFQGRSGCGPVSIDKMSQMMRCRRSPNADDQMSPWRRRCRLRARDPVIECNAVVFNVDAWWVTKVQTEGRDVLLMCCLVCQAPQTSKNQMNGTAKARSIRLKITRSDSGREAKLSLLSGSGK